MATTVHTITISVADLEDGTYALILGEPTTHRVDEFSYRAADVYDGHSLAGYLADMTLSALGIDEES